MNMLKIFTLVLTLGILSPAQAKLLQIIHTNDLHSFFKGPRSGGGGYARLKTIVDELRAQGEAQKIPTIFVDGGDFGEGSSFYFANNGVDSLKALDHLGVDVTVLGNHDYMLGNKELKRQIREAGLKAKILSANVKGKKLMGLSKLLPAYHDFELEDMKVRIFGLTTSEVHYQYPFRPYGYIASSHNTGIKMAEKAKRDGVDFLIALTHTGLHKDIGLVRKSRTIDLVVGGHSHTKLVWPEMTKNLEGRPVPIVQAGAHSLYVGSLLIDVQPKGQSTVVDYRLYDINDEIPEDQDMKDFVDEAYVKRDNYFQRSWDEVIGFSEIPLSGTVNGNQMEMGTCWSKHLARMNRQVAKADLGLHFDNFLGQRIPAGEITFGDVIDNFPHFRKWGDKGWKVSRATVNGFVLKKVLKLMAGGAESVQVTVDGGQVKMANTRGPAAYKLQKHSVNKLLVGGKPISNWRYYSIALPSEVPHAILKTLNVFGYVFLNNLHEVKDSDYWPLLENYIAENSPLRCLED